MNERLKEIAKFIDKNDYVVDIGTDQAYLPIYLVKNNLCKKVIATDIHESTKDIALNNIKKNGLDKDIKFYVTDGVDGVNLEKFDTFVIAGMGFKTIFHIVTKLDKVCVKKLIIQTNNDLVNLRCSLKKLGYYLQEESVIYYKNHYYVIGLYTKSKRRLKIKEKYFGIYSSNNLDYYLDLKNKLKNTLEKIPKKMILKRLEIIYQLKLLNKYL